MLFVRVIEYRDGEKQAEVLGCAKDEGVITLTDKILSVVKEDVSGITKVVPTKHAHPEYMHINALNETGSSVVSIEICKGF